MSDPVTIELSRADWEYLQKLAHERALLLFDEARKKPVLGPCPPEMDDLVRIRRTILHALDPQSPPPRNRRLTRH